MARKKAEIKIEVEETAEIESDVQFCTVFYRELTSNGERNGAVSSKRFESKKEAESFAKEVGGKLV